MIASLMMYQRPQLAEAHKRYWALIRDNLARKNIDSPVHLSQEADEFSVWENSDLVLSQTCGMPYRLWLHDKVTLVGTPDLGLADCAPGYYRSAIVVRHDDHRDEILDFKNAVFAYNQTYSQSGYNAPYWHCQNYGFWFESQMQTGQHVLSAKSVAEGAADIAALDAVSWRLISKYEGFADGLRVLDWTTPTPGLPLITAQNGKADELYAAVKQAISDLETPDRLLLGLKGIVKISSQAYLDVPNPPIGFTHP